MNKSIYITATILLTVLFSCKDDVNSDSLAGNEPEIIELQNTHTNLPLGDFATWVADAGNNLVKIKGITEINYKLSYMPKQCLAYIELKDEDFSKEQYEEAVTHYDGMSYFNFRLELANGSGELLKYNLNSGQQYNARIEYMSFRMQKDIYLIQGNDSINPGLFHFERIFEIAPYATVMMAFDNKQFDPAKEFTIVYNDRLFNKGLIKFNYRSKLLIDLPNITGV